LGSASGDYATSNFPPLLRRDLHSLWLTLPTRGNGAALT
jgi:hypothetical protein